MKMLSMICDNTYKSIPHTLQPELITQDSAVTAVYRQCIFKKFLVCGHGKQGGPL